MKKLFSILAVMLLVPTLAFALSLTVSATTTSGTNLGPHAVLKCKGYLFAANDKINPWDLANCAQPGTISALNFGTLSTILQNDDGTDSTNGADCFYARDFFIVYLYPDAWGGKGYELRQASATFPAAIANSVVMTPVYSKDDKYEGATTSQGDLIAGEVYSPTPLLAKNGGLILKAKRGRIVRAQYSIPPKKADDTPWATGWLPVPLTTTAGTYTSGTITIAITEWQ
jgi:hypothetical protein